MSAIGYVTNQDGSYTFEMPDGRKVTAAGPVAAQTALDLDNRMTGKGGGLWNEFKRGFGALGGVRQTSPFEQEGIGEAAKEAKQPEPQPPVQEPPQGVPGRYPTPNFNPPQQPPRVFIQKGGEMMAGRTTQHGPGLTPEDEEQLAGLGIDQRLATQELADAERAAQAGQNRVAALTHQNYVKREKDLREAEAARTAREEAALAESKAADDALGDYTIKPDRFWSSRSGWQKGVALLGGMLGGSLAARSSSGRNHFSEKLDEMVEEDIYAQKEELASLERKARAKKDYVAATQLANDRARLSENEMWEQRLKTLSAYAKRVEMETQDPIIAARAKLVDLDIQQKLAERFIAEKQAQRGTETRQYVNIPDRAVVIGGTGQPGPLDEADYSSPEVDKWVHTLSKDLDKLPQAEAELSSVDQMLKQYEGQGDIPGLGVMKEWIGENSVASQALLSEEGRLNQGKVQRMVNAYLKATSGSAVSKEEEQRVVQGLRGAKTVAELRAAVFEATNSLARLRQSIEAGVPKVAVRKYKQRGAYDPALSDPQGIRRGGQ